MTQASELNHVTYEEFLDAAPDEHLAVQLFLVVAVKRRGEDWAAYTLPVDTDSKIQLIVLEKEVAQVVAHGTKLSQHDARTVFFPGIAGQYRE